MDRRFEERKREMLEDCQVAPEVFQGMMRRLEVFAKPFEQLLSRSEQKTHALQYCAGLLSDLDQKNCEAIAYRHDEDRQGLQVFIGASPWDHAPWITELCCQVGREIGECDGVIAFDPSAFHKSGQHSVGTQRQWCGRLGKIDNCQVGVFMGYVSRQEHALVNMRLYLPRVWAKDRKRRKRCGVPPGIRYQTRHQLALQMLIESGHLLPHAWITGDDEMGRPYRFRRDLDAMQERYLLAVPDNTSIRDLEAEPPQYKGQGTHPKVAFQRVSKWQESQPDEAWTRVEVRDAEKGPLVVYITKRRVCTRTERRAVGEPETLVVIRYSEEGAIKHDYYLSNASLNTPLKEFARVAKAHHRIEHCIQRAKSEAGLGDYQVRTWQGWHHHVTLSLVATWFLIREKRRGEKMDTCHHGTANPRWISTADPACYTLRHASSHRKRTNPLAGAKRTGQVLSSQEA
jgi:SRSO17 transposase